MLDPSTKPTPQCYVRAVIILCSCVIAIACSVLIGWANNYTLLKSITTSFSDMKITTAIFLIISSIMLLLLRHENVSTITRRITNSFAISVIIGSLGCVYLSINKSYPNIAMSFITIINFVLLSMTLIFIDNKIFKTKLLFICITVIFLNSLFSLLGYVFIKNANYEIVALTRMSIYASISFIFLCIGIACARPDQGIVARLRKNSTDSILLRQIPLILFSITIVFAYFANYGQNYDWFDDGFSDLLTAISSIVVLIGILMTTANKLQKEESRGDTNEALFLGFSNNVNEVFWQSTPEMNKILYVSPAFEKIWGQTKAELINDPWAWFKSIDSNDQADVKSHLDDVAKNKTFVSFEYQLILPNGSKRYIYDRRFQQRDKQNKLIGILGISTDISDMHISNQRILAQLEIAKIIESGMNLKEITPKLLEVICRRFDWDVSFVALANKKGNLLECYAIWHQEKFSPALIHQLKNMTFNPGFGIPGKVFIEGKPLWKIDPQQPLNIIINAENDSTLRTTAAVPILYKHTVLGVLNVASQHIKPYDENMLKMFEVTGIQLGEYISHQHTEDKITQIIDQDSLTGLMTRSVLEERLQSKIDHHVADYFPVIILDLDKFKLINEELDYDIGDAVLKAAAEQLQNFTEKNLIARIGDNKFAIIPNDLDNNNQVTNFIYKIISTIKQPMTLKSKTIFISASIGISTYPYDGTDAKLLLKNANTALIKAKNEGGDNFQFYTEELSKAIPEKLTIISELKSAIAKNELLLYFQPKIDVKTKAICAAETLIRWQHPTKGLLNPYEFMSIAENNNLIIPITEWILTEACNIINKYKLTIPIAVNLSSEHFKENFNLIGYLNQILKAYHVGPSNLELEITESVFMRNTKQNLSVLIDLKRMGFKIAIDDFGTGFSSLSYLKNIAADYIKIDKSFIDNIPDNTDSVIITKAIIDLAHSLNKKVIAEGVESLRQLQFLVDHDCDQIQGYYFSKPLTIEDLVVLIHEKKRWIIPESKKQ
jgi:diguanylate cyclase (GGDEF)-like protein/PAS domain S-box-containing protein